MINKEIKDINEQRKIQGKEDLTKHRQKCMKKDVDDMMKTVTNFIEMNMNKDS